MTNVNAAAANLGFPRIGDMRQLKKVTESYWKGQTSQQELLNCAKEIRKNNWQTQQKAGIKYIPSNDFSLYDQVLDTIATFGAIPQRFKFDGDKIDLNTYFAMARGAQKDGLDVIAMEMTKFFDTNYHYIVAEFEENQQFKLTSNKIIDQFLEAKELGIQTRPVLLGPISFLLLGKTKTGNNIDLLGNLLPVYQELLQKLQEVGVTDLQIDEPFLITDLKDDVLAKYQATFATLKQAAPSIKLHLTTYFEGLGNNAQTAFNLDVDSIHLDLVRDEDQLDQALNLVKDNQSLSLGLVDGRNIWINDLEKSINIAKKAAEKLGKNRVIIAPSCSLLHSPVDLNSETQINEQIKSWLAFARQKLDEINAICAALNDQESDVATLLKNNKAANENRKSSPIIHKDDVKNRCKNINDDLINRKSDFETRKKIQADILKLPDLPTTTIGSFPQTQDIRKIRSQFKKGEISAEQYDAQIKEETIKCIRFQEEIDIDVLVHGEFERNDMVEYFGEQLEGFIFTKYGWVQSYGTRCVKPPIIFGDVKRKGPMTVYWSKFAQDQTKRVMKGMLTGPITMLQWSFVRNDQPRSQTANQIAFAIRDEVVDLQNAGIKIIQIDEAALREGLPIKEAKKPDYLNWAVKAFRITASGVEDQTQIHTHMCYSEFNDIITNIANMDADVISIETSRSQMELLESFVDFQYPNDIGPGVYDIHSPRVPSKDEMVTLLHKAKKVLKQDQIWVNPDCGLKTRGWPEVKDALIKMVNAAKELR